MKRFFFHLIPLLFSFLFISNHLTFNQASASDIPYRIFHLTVEGDPPIVWFEKGKILYKIMAWPDAAAAFRNMGNNPPQYMQQDIPRDTIDIIDESLYLLADSLLKTGDYSEAMSSINRMPGKSRFLVHSIYTKALISLNTGNIKNAVDYLEQVLKIIPDSKTPGDSRIPDMRNLTHKTHILLGFILMKENNMEEAAKHFALIPNDSPLYPQALYGSGWAYANLGRWVRAVIFWEELVYTSPESRYSREVIPYIGHAYTTLSAYGKALEQNGKAIGYYEDLLNKIKALEKNIQTQDINALRLAIEITGDNDLSEKLNLYNGLASIENDVEDIRNIVSGVTEPLIFDSKDLRKEILDSITEKLEQDIKELKLKLIEESAKISLEMARNLHLEGGGRINNDIIFNLPNLPNLQ